MNPFKLDWDDVIERLFLAERSQKKKEKKRKKKEILVEDMEKVEPLRVASLREANRSRIIS